MKRSLLFSFFALAVGVEPAFAHTGAGVIGGFSSGFLHPLTGADHMFAMVAVGVWGSQLGKPGIWVLPVTFPLVMAMGGVLGVRGVPLPGVEIGVAAAALLLGIAIMFGARPPLWAAMILVGVFAIFHGYAHGKELPRAAAPLAYGLGFVIATGLLHVCGITIGLVHKWPKGAVALRAFGGIIAAGGVYFVSQAW